MRNEVDVVEEEEDEGMLYWRRVPSAKPVALAAFAGLYILHELSSERPYEDRVDVLAEKYSWIAGDTYSTDKKFRDAYMKKLEAQFQKWNGKFVGKVMSADINVSRATYCLSVISKRLKTLSKGTAVVHIGLFSHLKVKNQHLCFRKSPSPTGSANFDEDLMSFPTLYKKVGFKNSVYLFDTGNASELLPSIEATERQIMETRESKYELPIVAFMGSSVGDKEDLPSEFPHDFFTMCMLSPGRAAVALFTHQRKHSIGAGLSFSVSTFLPDIGKDMRGGLWELEQCLHLFAEIAVADCLGKTQYKRLFMANSFNANLYRNFVIAKVIMRRLSRAPVCYPRLNDAVFCHSIWEMFDLAVEFFLDVTLKGIPEEEVSYIGLSADEFGAHIERMQRSDDLIGVGNSVREGRIDSVEVILPIPELEGFPLPQSDVPQTLEASNWEVGEVYQPFLMKVLTKYVHRNQIPTERTEIIEAAVYLTRALAMEQSRFVAIPIVKRMICSSEEVLRYFMVLGLVPYMMVVLRRHLGDRLGDAVRIVLTIADHDPAALFPLLGPDARSQKEDPKTKRNGGYLNILKAALSESVEQVLEGLDGGELCSAAEAFSDATLPYLVFKKYLESTEGACQVLFENSVFEKVFRFLEAVTFYQSGEGKWIGNAKFRKLYDALLGAILGFLKLFLEQMRDIAVNRFNVPMFDVLEPALDGLDSPGFVALTNILNDESCTPFVARAAIDFLKVMQTLQGMEEDNSGEDEEDNAYEAFMQIIGDAFDTLSLEDVASLDRETADLDVEAAIRVNLRLHRS